MGLRPGPRKTHEIRISSTGHIRKNSMCNMVNTDPINQDLNETEPNTKIEFPKDNQPIMVSSAHFYKSQNSRISLYNCKRSPDAKLR